MVDETTTPAEDTAEPTAETVIETAVETATDTTPEPANEAPADEPVSVVLTGHALIDTLDKDGLEIYARAEFNRELDKRKRIDTLRAEVKALFDGTTQKAEKAEAVEVAKAEARAGSTPIGARHKTRINPETGELWVFDWNPLYEGNSSLEPVYED